MGTWGDKETRRWTWAIFRADPVAQTDAQYPRETSLRLMISSAGNSQTNSSFSIGVYFNAWPLINGWIISTTADRRFSLNVTP